MTSSAVGQIIVTGAGGFIGRRLCDVLKSGGENVLALSRDSTENVGEINGHTDWSKWLHAGAIVVHLAGQTPVLEKDGAEDFKAFREVNVEGTRRLGFAAASAGVQRLVYLSSIGVLGSSTTGCAAFSSQNLPNPKSAYAKSKWEGEQVLAEVAAQSGLEVTVIRAPLVYGPHARGNFRRLVTFVRRGIPLPLGAVRNARSLIALDNLVDLIRVCIAHPEAAGKTFLASDGVSLSTPELIAEIARAMGTRSRLVPVPVEILRLAAKMLGKSADIERLVGSLEVDITDTRRILGWTPPFEMQECLRKSIAE